jgi:hypothetical protein
MHENEEKLSVNINSNLFSHFFLAGISTLNIEWEMLQLNCQGIKGDT